MSSDVEEHSFSPEDPLATTTWSPLPKEKIRFVMSHSISVELGDSKHCVRWTIVLAGLNSFCSSYHYNY